MSLPLLLVILIPDLISHSFHFSFLLILRYKLSLVFETVGELWYRKSRHMVL